jgi:hypothetical protein
MRLQDSVFPAIVYFNPIVDYWDMPEHIDKLRWKIRKYLFGIELKSVF